MKTFRRRLGRQTHYTALGLQLGTIAVDWRSRVGLALLGCTALLKQRSPWSARAITVRVHMKNRVYPIEVSGRIDLEVLREVGIADEYGASDDIEASVIVDLGAHVGFATLRLLADRPRARVIAVEADPALLPRLRANVRGLPVTVVHAAVCGESGHRTLYRSDDASWGNSLIQASSRQEGLLVPACTLIELMDRMGIDSAGLVKMDIEGAEWEVLRDGVPRRVRALIGELHAHEGHTPDELVRKIEESMTVTVVRGDTARVVVVAKR